MSATVSTMMLLRMTSTAACFHNSSSGGTYLLNNPLCPRTRTALPQTAAPLCPHKLSPPSRPAHRPHTPPAVMQYASQITTTMQYAKMEWVRSLATLPRWRARPAMVHNHYHCCCSFYFMRLEEFLHYGGTVSASPSTLCLFASGISGLPGSSPTIVTLCLPGYSRTIVTLCTVSPPSDLTATTTTTTTS